jgi:repressor LexA
MNRIKELRKNAHLSQIELAELCGVHQTAVSQWEQGRTNPDMETLMMLSEIFHASLGVILGLDVPDEPVTIAVKGLLQDEELMPIEEENICESIPVASDVAMRGDYCGIRVKGDNMEPLFKDGDLILARLQSEAKNNDIVFVIEGRRRTVVKRILYQDGGILLLSDNHKYSSVFYTDKQIKQMPIEIWGKVVEIRRSL